MPAISGGPLASGPASCRRRWCSPTGTYSRQMTSTIMILCRRTRRGCTRSKGGDTSWSALTPTPRLRSRRSPRNTPALGAAADGKAVKQSRLQAAVRVVEWKRRREGRGRSRVWRRQLRRRKPPSSQLRGMRRQRPTFSTSASSWASALSVISSAASPCRPACATRSRTSYAKWRRLHDPQRLS